MILITILVMMRMEDAKESVEVPEYKEDATAEETLKRQQAIEANRKGGTRGTGGTGWHDRRTEDAPVQ